MSRSPFLRSLPILAFALVCVSFGADASLSATRGETIHTVITSLGLPEWSGGEHFTDIAPGHPFSRSIETAAALGILPPAEQFYPDLEATRAEALMFALQAMGLRHEAAVLEALAPGPSRNIPQYIAPYLSLAGEIQPAPPGEFLRDPRGSLSGEELFSLGQWLRDCKRELLWRREFSADGSVLVLSRENVGTPPSEWAVQSREIGDPEEAERIAGNLRGLGLPAMTHALEWSWVVRIGPFQHYLEAWDTMMKIPSPEMTVVPFSQTPGRALFVAALGFDPARRPPRIVTAASISGRRLPLDMIAGNSGAEGAINGGFFSGVRIVGSLVINSFPASGPYGDRSAMGWSSNGSRLHFGRGDFRTRLSIGDRDFPVSTINSAPPQGGIGLFTPDVWTFVTGAPSDAWEMTVKNGAVAGVRHSAASNHFVTREGYLVIARGISGQYLQGIEKGTPVSVRTEWTDQGFNGLDFVLQAGPMLLRDGSAVSNAEGFGARTLSVPHPRSFIGTDGKLVWFVVVDGRDPWHSNGLTISETARIARQMGLENALNLDGGGSSSIWWRGRIVTSPPGGAIRPVPYAVVF